MASFTHEGVELSYQDEGAGLPVLLLHAFPLDGESFRPQLAALGNRFRFIVPDLRGFGRSGVGMGVSEMRTLARDALALLDWLGIESAVVGGVSMGGYVAMALLREDAGLVRGLVLADTQATADDEATKARREQMVQSVTAEGTAFLRRVQVPPLLSGQASETLRGEVDALAAKASPEGAVAALRGMALRPDSQELLGRFGGPALILCGEHDAVTPPAKARRMAELIQGSTLVEIPQAGHLSNLENPEAFNASLDGFLSSPRLLAG
jgi:pimeloyl-ACP methyl ester carboxylesterase